MDSYFAGQPHGQQNNNYQGYQQQNSYQQQQQQGYQQSQSGHQQSIYGQQQSSYQQYNNNTGLSNPTVRSIHLVRQTATEPFPNTGLSSFLFRHIKQGSIPEQHRIQAMEVTEATPACLIVI
jgi:hypothetical protein